MRVLTLWLILTALILWGCERDKTITGATSGSEIVTFPDSALENAVRAALQEPTAPITLGDLEGMTEFEAAEWGITDLTGLENMRSLQRLVLTSNSIDSIPQVAGITTLQEIVLDYNDVDDLGPLQNLPNLRIVRVRGNGAGSLTPLSNSGHVNHLDEAFNGI